MACDDYAYSVIAVAEMANLTIGTVADDLAISTRASDDLAISTRASDDSANSVIASDWQP
jgi:hypothetical protein